MPSHPAAPLASRRALVKVAISGGFQVGGFSLSGKVAASVCAIVSVPAFHLDSTHHAGGLGTVLNNLAMSGDIGIRHGISVLRSHLLIILASLVCIFSSKSENVVFASLAHAWYGLLAAAIPA